MTENELMYLLLTDYPAFLKLTEEYLKGLEIAEWLDL